MDADAVRKTREHYNSHANVFVDRDQVQLFTLAIMGCAALHYCSGTIEIMNIGL